MRPFFFGLCSGTFRAETGSCSALAPAAVLTGAAMVGVGPDWSEERRLRELVVVVGAGI